MSNKQNKLIKELISKLEQDGVDVSKYTQELDNINSNLRDKKYGLVWEQHTEPLIEELKSKVVELQEVKERRIFKGEDYTNNFLIEGDNLESLNTLKNSGKKVELIYIDPPYNTGNEFVYNDKIVNKEDSFKHSKWLSFMEKRLVLARELMSDEGLLLISIDDNEYSNLIILLGEIFGSNNIETMIWQKVGDGNASAGKMKQTYRFRAEHEYIIFCYKNKDKVKLNKYMNKPDFKNKYTNPDNDPRGPYKAGSMGKPVNKANIKGKNYYTITTPSGREITTQWHFDENTYKQLDKDGRIYYGKNGNSIPSIKIFINELRPTTPTSILLNMGSASMGSSELHEMLGKVFDNPKPTKLLKHLITLYPNRNATVLDFFAGSGTTGHTCLELNKEDGGNRRFILCTNNENNICEDITYQRLNKVINGYTTPKGKEVEGVPANLTYLKTKLINKEDDYIMYENSHLEYIINLLKLKYGITNEVDLNNSEDVENKLIKLSTESQDIYVYLNDYIDEEDFNNIELNKEKDNTIYVDESLVNDKYLLLKGFKNISSVNNYFK